MSETPETPAQARKRRREEKAAELAAQTRAATAKPEKPPKGPRGNNGNHRPKMYPEKLIETALRETGGNVTRAADLMTKWRQERSDIERANREKRAARAGNSLPAETAEEKDERHRACRVVPRTIRHNIRESAALQEAQRAAFQDVAGEARDKLHVLVEKGYFPAVKLVLETHDPAFQRKVKVTGVGGVVHPGEGTIDGRDPDSMTDEELERIADEGEPKDA